METTMPVENRWRRYLLFITDRPRWIVALTVIVTLAFAFAARGMKVQNNRDLWLPHDNPLVQTTKTIGEIFGGRDVVVIGITPVQGDIYQPFVLEKIARLQQHIAAIPEAIKNNVVSLAARKAKAIHGAANGMEVARMFTGIPTSPADIAKLKAAVAENPFYVGALVSPDGRYAAVIADFKQKKDALGYSALSAAIAQAIDTERDATVNLYVAGAPISFSAIEHYSEASGIYFAMAFVVIMLVLYWSFGTVQGMLLPMVTAILSVVWALGVLALVGFDLDVVNTTTPILIMAVTSGHAIQLLKRYYEEYARLAAENTAAATPAQLNKLAVIESLTRVGPVTAAAGIVAVATFCSLLLAHVELVQHFGLFAAAGIFSGLILELSFIPALRSMLKPPSARAVSSTLRRDIVDRVLLAVSNNIDRMAPRVLVFSVLTVVVLAVGMFRLHVDNSTLRYLALDNRVRADDRVINNAFGGSNTIYFMIEGDRPDTMKDPRVLAGMERLQAFLAQQPEVGKTQSLADLIKRMNRAMHGDDVAYATVPTDQALIAQYLLLYSLSGDPQDFDNYVDSDYQRALVWAYVKDDSSAYFERLVAAAQPLLKTAFPPGIVVRVGGTLAEVSATNDVIVHEKIVNTAQMALVIFVLTSLMLRSAIGGLFVVIPVLVIVAVNFGVMGWLGIALDMGTATTASMAIGIGADYELYLLYRFREELARTHDIKIATERSLLTAGKAILFIAAAIAGGYSVLFASDFVFYSHLAVTVIMTMAISALSAIVLLRALIHLIRPRFVFGDGVPSGVVTPRALREAQ